METPERHLLDTVGTENAQPVEPLGCDPAFGGLRREGDSKRLAAHRLAAHLEIERRDRLLAERVESIFSGSGGGNDLIDHAEILAEADIIDLHLASEAHRLALGGSGVNAAAQELDSIALETGHDVSRGNFQRGVHSGPGEQPLHEGAERGVINLVRQRLAEREVQQDDLALADIARENQRHALVGGDLRLRIDRLELRIGDHIRDLQRASGSQRNRRREGFRFARHVLGDPEKLVENPARAQRAALVAQTGTDISHHRAALLHPIGEILRGGVIHAERLRQEEDLHAVGGQFPLTDRLGGVEESGYPGRLRPGEQSVARAAARSEADIHRLSLIARARVKNAEPRLHCRKVCQERADAGIHLQHHGPLLLLEEVGEA